MQDKSTLPHAVIVTGGSNETRRTYIEGLLTEAGIAPYNRIRIAAEGISIGIKEIRDFIRNLSASSFGPSLRSGIIWGAQLLTVEAQNALLKTLEEPPANARIILETASMHALLSTIISRSVSKELPHEEIFSADEQHTWHITWEKLIGQSLGQRVKTIDGIFTTRDGAIEWVDCGIATLRNKLLAPDADAAAVSAVHLRKLLHGRNQLSANVTPKLVVDNLFLSS